MSGRLRQIKDPIYGYIYLPDDYVQGVVDTPVFQRLRKISQTSYEALYPSATHICDELSSVELFGEKGISTEGVEIPLCADRAVGRNYRIRLMSDGDVLFLLKNNESDFSLEYFDRRKRKHPLWKTEHEYKSHFKEEGWTEFFKSVAKYDGVSAPGRIDGVALERCQRNVVDCERACKDASSQEQEKCSDQLALAVKMQKRLEMFKSFADEVHVAFDFVLLQRKPFESGFNKQDSAI